MSDHRSAAPAATPPTPTQKAAGGLTGRTFIGLLIAQFLAAFNDQAIHAAAMFYAINTHALSERDAISLMPILFYAPWAIFCTVAGWMADRYSKREALVRWKMAEVAIAAVALAGFWLGRSGYPVLGPWLVLAAVFGMGTHSAFFVPAKYGIMPEILPPEKLSKGNGLLESLSFLAVILGTVSGGVLSYLYLGKEYLLGLILFTVAVVGAVASLLVRKVPAANPTRPFPPYLFGPLVENLRTLVAVRPLRVALYGIAFFTFVVAFMRAAVYMLGESQNPRWDELKTSVIVGTVALGIGLGSPLAGYLSGRRIELRLVILGAAGMILMLLGAAALVDQIPWLVVCIVGIGFFTGFYIVPLFTLLQHKAPKTAKGEMIATSNFVNVTGAIAASMLFFAVVYVAQWTGLAPPITDRTRIAQGNLTRLTLQHGRPVFFEVSSERQSPTRGGIDRPVGQVNVSDGSVMDRVLERIAPPKRFAIGGELHAVINLAKGVQISQPGEDYLVDVWKYTLADVPHYDLVPAGTVPEPDFDNRHLPRYLFVGAAGMTALILVVLLRPILRLRREGV